MILLGNNVISKTIKLLKAFTDNQSEWGVNELARFLEIPVSSVHRMMKILRSEKILEYSDITKKYQVGEELIRMSSIIIANSDIKNIARPYLENISRVTGKSAYLSQYYKQHKKLAFIDCVRSSSALQYILSIGVLEPIHIAASGKTILAFLDTETVEHILDRERIFGESRNELIKELGKIREDGYAITYNERKEGALSIGAPIFDATNEVIGSVICVSPIIEYNREHEEVYTKNVIENAKNISYFLGYKK